MSISSRKLNHKLNVQRKKQERWYEISVRLSGFEGLINDYNGASSEEVRTMKVIHGKLYECFVLAKEHLKEAENYDRFLR